MQFLHFNEDTLFLFFRELTEFSSNAFKSENAAKQITRRRCKYEQ